jgi:hypothetical protein
MPFAILLFLAASSAFGVIYLAARARRIAATETLEQKRGRQRAAAKGLKLGVILFSLFFLNGIRMAFQNEIPWKFAALGLAINAFLVVTCWTSLRRLKKSQIGTPPATSPQS